MRAAVAATFAISETIRELKEVPAGNLYAALMSKMDLEQFNALIDILIKAGVVERTPCHLLRWIGPACETHITDKSYPEGAEESYRVNAEKMKDLPLMHYFEIGPLPIELLPEYDGAARWCAQQGLTGKLGDALPDNMDSDGALKWINADPEAFQQRVKDFAYGLAMEKVNMSDS